VFKPAIDHDLNSDSSALMQQELSGGAPSRQKHYRRRLGVLAASKPHQCNFAQPRMNHA
jgi:hypothetical protein